jgi:hypothetical protein
LSNRSFSRETSLLIYTVDTSAPEGRRYGEPDWERRPVDFSGIFYGIGNGLLRNQHFPPRHQPEFPKYTEQSYEEWKLEELVKRYNI